MERNSTSSWLPPWTRLEHEARYQFAAKFVHDKVVVDCACGTGIGSQLFVKSAAEVFAIDSSSEALEELSEASNSKIRVIEGNATNLDLPDNCADIFISLETIEHIQDDAALIAESYRVLKPNGLFICSTPNRNMTNPGTSLDDKPWNPFHVREYNLAEFRAKLERRFEIIGVYGQNPASKGRVRFGQRLASLIGTSLVIKLNKLLKCRWFVWPSPAHHAVQPAAAERDYEFYILVGKISAIKF